MPVTKTSLCEFLLLCGERHVVMTALKVSVVVGLVLNLINQGGRMIEGDGISWIQVGLNFVVPYCVSTYSAARNEANRIAAVRSPTD